MDSIIAAFFLTISDMNRSKFKQRLVRIQWPVNGTVYLLTKVRLVKRHKSSMSNTVCGSLRNRKCSQTQTTSAIPQQPIMYNSAAYNFHIPHRSRLLDKPSGHGNSVSLLLHFKSPFSFLFIIISYFPLKFLCSFPSSWLNFRFSPLFFFLYVNPN